MALNLAAAVLDCLKAQPEEKSTSAIKVDSKIFSNYKAAQ